MDTRYKYVAELDSVRKSPYDQLAGEQALYRALILEGRTVALSYNQVIDSVAFLRLFEEENRRKVLLSFFEDGKLLVNQFGNHINLSKYVQDRYASKGFISSYLEFLNRYDTEKKSKVMGVLMDCLRYDDPIYLEKRLRELALEQTEIVKMVNYAKTILKINRLLYDSKCYIESKSSGKYNSMVEVMGEIAEMISGESSLQRYWHNIIERMQAEQTDDRSTCFNFIENMDAATPKEQLKMKELANLAYVVKVSDSINGCEPISLSEKAVREALVRPWIPDSQFVDNRLKDMNWQKGYRTTKVADSVLSWKVVKGVWQRALSWSMVKSSGYALAMLLAIFSGEIIGDVIDFILPALWMKFGMAMVISVIVAMANDKIRARAYAIMPKWSKVSFGEHIVSVADHYKTAKKAKEMNGNDKEH